ncbi:hypothetical protein [Maribacter hydrothermalis]|uniref:Uncharacterized protein n=1 Tax=Maribacter hydrothermalis TaxID=1836467 RepID=A0A1B7Z154_9FLAO|nr:hypothetical protein [Maribacter hydrothermalis]APQ18105.1 hypothetical protein BTR34_12540 [Maribacter hydrothermalis]OBR36451.1 hypothetical protein A9200_08435 [Maribacter hydrothermalis]
MNAKWCVSTLFIILALFGLSQEQKKASNQQILLQFADVELASKAAHDEVLAVITKKLEVLGVDAIEVIENDGAQLSIRYYSDVDAISVKEFLSKENALSLTIDDEFPADSPKEQLPEKYNLVVSDLLQQIDNCIALNATLVVVQKQDDNTFAYPVLLQFNNTLVFEQDVFSDKAYKIYSNIALAIDNTSQIIPEVRAGPYTSGNS